MLRNDRIRRWASVVIFATLFRPSAAEQVTATSPWTAVYGCRNVDIIELAPPLPGAPSADILRKCELETTAQGFTRDPWHNVAAFPRWTGGHLSIAGLRLSTGGWSFVKSELPGGTRVSLYLTIDHDIDDTTLFTKRKPELISALRLADQEPGAKPRITDVSARCIVERAKAVYLLGESLVFYPDAPDDFVIWAAPARIVEGVITGRVIAKGRDPHVAQLGNRTIVAFHVPQPMRGTHPAWGKRLYVYASDDLEQWKPFPGPPDDLEFGDFDLCVTRDGLTIVGLADTNPPDGRTRDSAPYEPALALVTLVYDTAQQRWNTVAARRDKSLSPEMEVKVIPPEAIDGRLMLIERQPDGRFTARSPMQ